MSQQDHDSENEIWDYKPLKKTRRQEATPDPNVTNSDGRDATTKRKPASKRIAKGETAAKPGRNNVNVKTTSRAGGQKATSHEYIQPSTTSQSIQPGPSQSIQPGPSSPSISARSKQFVEPLTVDNVFADSSALCSGGFCPICQMPFSVLAAQSLHRWHVTECMDTAGDDSKECPDGVWCSSTVQSHYKTYSHAVLALSRATDGAELALSRATDGAELALSRATDGAELALSRAPDDAELLGLSQTPIESPGCSFSAQKDADAMSSGESFSSQESDLNIFTLSSPSSSPVNRRGETLTPSKPTLTPSKPTLTPSKPTLTPSKPTLTPSKPTNALLLLRSPGPEDIRKKKGWSPSAKALKSTRASPTAKVLKSTRASPTAKGLKSTKASQKSTTKVLTPVNAYGESLAVEGGFIKAQPSPLSDEDFSYSPLSEYPPDLNINTSKLRKELFPLRSASENENDDDDSVILLDDSVDQEFFSGDTQVMLVSSSADINQPARATAANGNVFNSPFRGEIEELAEFTCNGTSSGLQLQSPQSLVLERLRERVSEPNSRGVLQSNSFNECPAHIKTEETPAYTQLVHSSSQTFSQLSPGGVALRKAVSRAGPASGLKQTDIGVFFGLKPLKEKETEGAAPERKPGAVAVRARREGSVSVGARREGAISGRARRGEGPGGGQGRRGGAGVGVAEPGETTEDVKTQSTRGEGWRGGGGRRWRNRGRTDGEPEEPKRCPFYKKIPGTKFVVDAFQYGLVDGVTAYFLTHFHSDHYGGLKKNSTFPIYCNKITGNLVQSKLKVQEQHIHVLPMNTEVTVEGVKVVLLEANHCPGAAMLLLFLPDGQVVLHVGDFRADPSMELYPELLSTRVQTLYLDTTYCSPEYTFPSQKEVISFAVSAAFERVTLHPRTLVVCGSYSVGKENVFLALAEALGSKVSMSRDKFNTMLCLESERVRRLITTDWRAAQVHVLPMMHLAFTKLQAHLARFSGKYDRVVAFKPTGWTFSQNAENVENVLENIQPQTNGNVSIYGIPYSEHSSFLELKRFVQWLRPLKIIPTVNVGSRDGRRAMEKCFREWLAEASG